MANKKLDVVRGTDGTVGLFKNGKAVSSVTIKKDVDMEIAIGSGFGSGAYVSAFTLYEEDNGGKGSEIGTWSHDAPTGQPSSDIAISVLDTTGVKVTDTDGTAADEDVFFFSVQVTDGTSTFDTDPELKVKKANG